MTGRMPAAIGRRDAHFSRRRVGQELDLADALAELIEDGDAAPDERLAVNGGFNALPTAVEKSNAERVLQLADRLRYGRLCQIELGSRLHHASPLHDGVEQKQVAQLEPVSNAIDRSHDAALHEKN
jgi:hypothetical protein